MDAFESPGSPDARELQMLERRLTALAEAVPFALHYAVEPIAPAGEVAAGVPGHITRGAETVVPSFSTRKVGVLCAALALARAGRLDPQQRLRVTAEHREGVQAGILRHLSPGIELTLDDCLVQMMCTSDNICTQLVFEAIGTAVADLAQDALQFVNDYCAWAGMRSTLHREVFPRTGGLDWHHPVDGLTVTTAADQARLLAMIGRGAGGPGALEAAARLQLTPAGRRGSRCPPWPSMPRPSPRPCRTGSPAATPCSPPSRRSGVPWRTGPCRW